MIQMRKIFIYSVFITCNVSCLYGSMLPGMMSSVIYTAVSFHLMKSFVEMSVFFSSSPEWFDDHVVL